MNTLRLDDEAIFHVARKIEAPEARAAYLAQVCGELDWIVMKALEKDRNRRYETAMPSRWTWQRYLKDEQGAGVSAVGGLPPPRISRRHRESDRGGCYGCRSGRGGFGPGCQHGRYRPWPGQGAPSARPGAGGAAGAGGRLLRGLRESRGDDEGLQLRVLRPRDVGALGIARTTKLEDRNFAFWARDETKDAKSKEAGGSTTWNRG